MALGFKLKTKSASSMVSSADIVLCKGGVKLVLGTTHCHYLSH